MRQWVAGFAAVSFALVLGQAAWGAIEYNVIDLDTLGGATSSASDINNSGQVVGTADSGSGTQHAFFFNGSGPLLDLGTLPGRPFSGAASINDSGQIVGTARSEVNGSQMAFLYNGSGPLVSLGTFNGASWSIANDINNGGQIVGSSGWIAGQPGHAFLYSGSGPMQDIGPAYATGINNSGQVAGTDSDAWLYTESGPLQHLGTLGGPFAETNRINDNGNIVGTSDNGSAWRAFLYNGSGALQDLGTLSGFGHSNANGINSNGRIVGNSYNAGDNNGAHAFLYTGSGPLKDLNALIDSSSGWILTSAQAINDSGQIVGYGYHNGQQHAFLADPIPEPSTLVLLSVGTISVLAHVWRRRKRG